MGIIPGSMADPSFVIKGLGNEDAINSAAHGAGRAMSRNAAMKLFTFKDLQDILQKKQITLISAGLDEIPMAYKNIHHVMDQQWPYLNPGWLKWPYPENARKDSNKIMPTK